jgi:2-hydroxychromene-2-carboxylate isomerase
VTEPVRVAIDFKSPEAYLAVAPARALEVRLGQTFEWLPFDVPPLSRPPAPSPTEDRGARHRRIRGEYLANDLRRYAAARGLELGELCRGQDTTAASLGLLWLRRNAPALAGGYVARVFERLWRDDADADAAFVERSLGQESVGFRVYADREGPQDLVALRAELEAAAVWNVPAFLVAGELFLGRAHLPIVEWLATGRPGPPPI